MSSALAIAGVTAVLKDLLLNESIDADWTSAVGEVRVTALPPDRVVAPNGGEASQLNLFMYQATPNAAWRNAELPSRDPEGRRTSNPPLALDLHYLLTAYSGEELHAEILLGYAMQLLHETPILERGMIQKSLAPGAQAAAGLPLAMRQLSTSGLAEQLELVKLVLEPLSTEEISKLWAAFQTTYRPTAAYQASVVLIERERPVRATLPVREGRLHVVPFRRPAVRAVAPQVVAPSGSLTVEGVNLAAAGTFVDVGGEAIVPAGLTDQAIELALPATLPAGVHALQVVQPFDFGTSQEPHGGLRSNVVAFVLAPAITTALPVQVAAGATLTLSIEPLVEARQELALLLGDRSILLPARELGSVPQASFDFPIPADVPLGMQLVRVQVDGAQSALETDPGGAWVGPLVEVT